MNHNDFFLTSCLDAFATGWPRACLFTSRNGPLRLRLLLP